jgi:hypothetical protein
VKKCCLDYDACTSRYCHFALLLAIWYESNNLLYHVCGCKDGVQWPAITRHKSFCFTKKGTNLLSDDQWAYDLVANIDQCLPNTQLGNCSRLTGHAGGDEHTSPGKHQGKKGRGVSRRGGSFTKEDDTIICSAFVNVSKDPIVGVNQSSGGYYKRMHDYYQAHKPAGSNRSQLAIQGRWGTIQKVVSRFCGIKSAIDRRQESGKNEQDRVCTC